jgi:hypothetical protein
MTLVADPNLRILVIGTPKTGNTWVRSLLGATYRLPQLYLEPGFKCPALDAAGERWIAQYHMRPNAELTAWVREHHATVVTTIRHPADVLISLYHHISGFRARSLDFDKLRAMLTSGFERTDIIADWDGQPFWADLTCSLDWIEVPGTAVVRYEDLRCDTPGTLREVTSRIHEVPEERIEAAIEMSDLRLMRAMAGPFGGFFREGSVGAWRELLPADVIEVFRSVAPYPELSAALGYSMDPGDPTIARAVGPRTRHPMADLERFENGVPVAPILRQCFFWALPELRTGWQEHLAATGPSSYYDWLNQASGTVGRGSYEELPLSNLAAFAYGQRPDLRATFPDLTGSDRCGYALWFVRNAESEYGLDTAFAGSQRGLLMGWANTACNREGAGIYAGLALSNIAAYLYDQLTELQLTFPDLTGSGRCGYALWFLRHGEIDGGLEGECVEWQRAATMSWANEACARDGSGIYAGLSLTNLARFLYDDRADLRETLPDLTGSDRYRYVRWFLRHAEPESVLGRPCVESQRAALMRWAGAASTREGAGLYTGLQLPNIAVQLYDARADLRRAFPDLTGGGRYEYLLWFLRHAAEAECGLDGESVRALRSGLIEWANTTSYLEGGETTTNFVLHVCGTRTDVPGSFPLLGDEERRHLVRSVLAAAKALGMDAEYTTRLESTLGRHWLPESMRARLQPDQRLDPFEYVPERLS